MEDAEMARKLQEEINAEVSGHNNRQPVTQNPSIASAPPAEDLNLEDGLGTNGYVVPAANTLALQPPNQTQTQLSEALSKLATANSIQIMNSKSGHGKMGFEIRPNKESYISMFGAEDNNMINGFSLKVLTLGLVNTKFSLSLNSNGVTNDGQPSKVLEITRPIGMSEYIEVWLAEFGDFDKRKRLIGYVRPTSFKLTRIEFAVCGPKKVERGRMRSYALRGLFTDGYEFVQAGSKATGAKMDRSGLISLTQTGQQFDLENRLLLVAAGMLIKFNI